jgi:hypothetical protein
MCLIITYTEVCLEKQLSQTFLILNDDMATLLFIFTVRHAITEVQENHRKMDKNISHKLLYMVWL